MAAERHIAQALAALRARYGALLLSSTYQSPAAGFEGDDFLNLAVGIDTDETPEAVMRSLREIEDACGRVRGGPKFSARTMDLDLLGRAVIAAYNKGPAKARSAVVKGQEPGTVTAVEEGRNYVDRTLAVVNNIRDSMKTTGTV